jgi:nitric oxide synthase oxygenase domain/subunit
MVRLAWRNNARCIGRLFWESLHLFDARAAGSPDEVFEACVKHLEYATNGGRIRPAVTVFASASGTPSSSAMPATARRTAASSEIRISARSRRG